MDLHASISKFFVILDLCLTLLYVCVSFGYDVSFGRALFRGRSSFLQCHEFQSSVSATRELDGGAQFVDEVLLCRSLAFSLTLISRLLLLFLVLVDSTFGTLRPSILGFFDIVF